jgi:hypothetical protein
LIREEEGWLSFHFGKCARAIHRAAVRTFEPRGAVRAVRVASPPSEYGIHSENTGGGDDGHGSVGGLPFNADFLTEKDHLDETFLLRSE